MTNSHSNAVEKRLNFDALATAEEITGENYKDDKGTAALGMLLHMESVAAKNALLSEMDDTSYSSSWPDFLRIIAEEGWEIKLVTTDDPDRSEFDTPDQQIIAYHAGMHALMVADSYWGQKKINGGKFYFAREYDEYADRVGGSGGGYEKIGDRLLFCGYLSFTGGGLRHNTAKLCSAGKAFTENWPEDSFIWLYTSWEERESKKSDFKDRNEVAVSRLKAAGLDPARFGL